MFHSLRSLLFKDGIKERSHLCAIEYIKIHYPEIKEEALTIDFYRRFRHTALYGLDASVLNKDAEEAIHFAKNFLSKIKKRIK